ncbi:helix-turn-helix transcriptional regulator [Mesorhizobium sp. YC-39]|uniref:helix-turn-helix transcriptional regulator n=1 Tax=unclassified Mesorhizobium TaxID=325217 RepID=UPI0021E953EC|nr:MULTISPECIES: helix-turn-helix transcriptional regulator [unclassified Mesorhizobium]MCV3206871.1 helix-turn-helix transcriptional regulator [Mesorhizobium sp. YC-2]MCV3228597.1 helix-turn-helix transcriptional regulator [Mesorhizobium sp. YC-39]
MAVEAIIGDRTADGVVAERRLIVLIALGDAAHAEHLSSALAASGDILPVTAGSSGGGERADVAVIDERNLQRLAIDPAIPRVLLSRRTGHEPPADNLFAVLPAAVDDLLIAAAVRLAAAGYRISDRPRRMTGRHDDFAFHDGDALDEEPVDDGTVRPALSPRESEVLALLAEGAPNKVIARRLNISVHTAKFHVAAILIKLGAANRTDAIAIAMRQGLVLV